MSSIRVNPNPTPDLLAALSDVQQQVNTATLQLATGSRINQPSDDPAGAAQVTQIHSSAPSGRLVSEEQRQYFRIAPNRGLHAQFGRDRSHSRDQPWDSRRERDPFRCRRGQRSTGT